MLKKLLSTPDYTEQLKEILMRIENEIKNLLESANDEHLQSWFQKTIGQNIQQNLINLRDRLKNVQQEKFNNSQLRNILQNYHDNLNTFFIGKAINNSADRQYLVQQLKTFLPKKTIVKTKLLYMFPQKPKINFHECVDSQPDFVVVIRLKNDHVIAFYSEVGLSQEADSSHCKGFLASLTNKRTFFLKRKKPQQPQAKLFVYDPKFLKMGNGDLQLQLNQDGRILSSVEARECYFEFEGEKTEILFGSSEKKASVISCEVFQIISK